MPARPAAAADYCAEQGHPYDECGKVVVAATRRAGRASPRSSGRAPRTACPGCAGSTLPGCARSSRTRGGRRAALARDRDHRLPGDRRRLADDVEAAGGQCGSAPRSPASPRASGWRLAPTARQRFDRLIVCAGLQTDRVARLAGGWPGPAIVPFRGEYYAVRRHARDLVPRPDLPGAGPGVPVPRRPLHAARSRRPRDRAERRARPGPRGLPRDATSSLADLSQTLATRRVPGGWPAGTGGRACASCAARCRSAAFVRGAAALRSRDSGGRRGAGPAGRPGAGGRPRRHDGRRLPDQRDRPGHRVRNAPSPAATSSPGDRRARRGTAGLTDVTHDPGARVLPGRRSGRRHRHRATVGRQVPPGAARHTGTPVRQASATSLSVPQLPPTATSASAERTSSALRSSPGRSAATA